ncbi:hypothetical protein G6F62_012515 [Rhizopus arrhizus]|nr:hypothetical protein G6F62_012515 [Rhizopus arrhizus]
MSNNLAADSLLLGKSLFERGYNCLTTLEDAMQAMENVGIQEESVSRALALIIRTHSMPQLASKEEQTWNIENFVKAVLKKNSNLNWDTVLAKLDQAEFMVFDPIGFKLLVLSWKCYKKDEPFPVSIFFQPWVHIRAQLSVLYHMVYAPTDLLDLNETMTRKVIPEELVSALPVSMRQGASQLALQQLNCLDLIDTIISLVGTAATDDIKVLMDRLAIQAPELLMIGLAQIQVNE